MPVAQVGGVELHYRVEGDGPATVVLVNGLGDDLATWDPQVPALTAAGYRVLRFDNRGVGLSSAPAGPYSTAQLAADLRALVDALGIDEFHLVGLSMGGMVAQELALACPDRVRSLVLACTYAAPSAFCSRLFAGWSELAASSGVAAVMRQVLLWAFTPEVFEEQPSWLIELEREVAASAQSLPAYQAQLAAVQAHDARDRLPHLATRTLVLTGAQDILIPVSVSRSLHDLLPNSEFATTPGGHACSLERADAFNGAVLGFLRSAG